MTDYQLQPITKRCATTGRELKPGEKFYSVLSEEAGKFVRRDYCLEGWTGPPEGALGFWQGKFATGSVQKKLTIDDELIIECFNRLEGQLEPSRISFRYVLALLMMRRKRLQLLDAKQEGGQEVLTFRCPRTGVRHLVVNPNLSDEALEEVQEDVFQALGWD